MHVTSIQTEMAGQLIEAMVGQAQQAQTDLAMKLARVSLAQSLQSPTSSASVDGVGEAVDVVV
tara:strand:+ start:271 stop:459 length:189 start_codon:yes stop_codon:yes gene_type:complete